MGDKIINEIKERVFHWRMQDYVDVCNGNFVDLNYEYGN